LELQGGQHLMEIPGMTHATAAAVLGVSESTVSRWIGLLPKSAPVSRQSRSPRGGKA
jgi:transposase